MTSSHNPVASSVSHADVVLVQCPMMSHLWPSTGIGYLCEYLRSQGFRPRALDLNIESFHTFGDPTLFRPDRSLEWYDERLFSGILERHGALLDLQARAIAATDAPVVGFSVSGSNARWTREIARRVRRLAPGRLIVFGGCEFPRPEAVGGYRGEADVFVIGEGEDTLLEILTRHRAGENIEGIAGTALSRPDGSLSDFEPRPFRSNLDDFPFPTFAEADLRRYLFPNVCICSSRGCIRRCTFCSDHPRWMRYRSRSVENVLAEMEYHAKKRLSETFYVTSSLLNADLKWLEDLCEALIERRLGWDIVTEMCIDGRMTPEFFRRIRRAGISRIEYGLESGSNRILRAMNKAVTREVAARALADTHAAGIECQINLIAGFPGETEIEHGETLAFLRENASSIDTVKTVWPCGVLPNSPLRRDFEKYGIENPDDIAGWRIGMENTPEIRQRRTDELIAQARRLGIHLAFERQPIGVKSYLKPGIFLAAMRSPRRSLRKVRRVLRWSLSR